jgi:rhamnosyltransferase
MLTPANHRPERTHDGFAGAVVGGVAVTYRPSATISDRLARMAGQVDVLIVVDNSACTDATERLAPIVAGLNGLLITNDRNLGIATALNIGTKAARARQADWVVFFDQDSVPADDFRTAIGTIVAAYDESPPLGIVGSNFLMTDVGLLAFAVPETCRKPYMRVNEVMTSGSAYRIEMMAKLGTFRDDFFIDCVDSEYCLRAWSNGYAVCRSTRALITHALGAPSFHTLRGRRVGTSNHAPFRRYYMARNNFTMARLYYRRLPHAIRSILKVYVQTVVVMCIFERQRAEKIAYTLLGLWHGLCGRMDFRPRAIRPHGRPEIGKGVRN